MIINQNSQPKPVSIRTQVAQLMGTVKSKARKKAIITIAKKHNITRTDAQFRQAISIAKSVNRRIK